MGPIWVITMDRNAQTRSSIPRSRGQFVAVQLAVVVMNCPSTACVGRVFDMLPAVTCGDVSRFLAPTRLVPPMQAAKVVKAKRAVLTRGRTMTAPTRGGASRHARLETLLEISRELSKIQPVESLLDKIAHACGHLLDSDSVGVRVRHGDDLVLAGACGDARAVMVTPRLKVGESLSGVVAATGKPLVVDDPASDPRITPAHRETIRRGGYTAFLGVPLLLGDQVLGVLSIRTRREQGFPSEDLALATAFASQAAVALENSRLYQEAQRAYDELAETQEQLTQARKMEAIGRLAGGVAHDFNNLLLVMIGRSELLLRQLGADDPLRPGLELIEKTAGRAADLTRQLLAFSRKQMLQPVTLDLNATVFSMGEMLGRVIGEDIAFVTALDPELGSVRADPSQIEQIVLNLAVNARDAMPNGGRLTIETSNVELDATYARHDLEVRPGPHVMLAVSDTGIGMDEDTRARMFEPFFTTKGPGKGTGLGLATVYGVVKQSGGYIWVYSEPARGTTFKIYLPRVDQASGTEESPPPTAHAAQGRETVLLVEDEAAVRELLRDIVEANGYTVLEARDASEALEVSERYSGPIHLLLTDVVMPGMSGRQLADDLTKLRPGMMVLYMSGYTDHAIVHHGVLDADAVFLQKPFTADALTGKLREILDCRRSGGILKRSPSMR
jgi:signal transduction histidine kinase/ActR/RegA family two-component response regulator